jgi:hypothetical protein
MGDRRSGKGVRRTGSWLGRAGRWPVVGAAGLLVAGLSVVGPATTASALPSNCTQTGSTVNCSFSSTGAEQAFTVPSGTSTVTISAVGAPGAVFGDFSTSGGAGGVARSTVSLSPGVSTLYVEVGGAGGRPGPCNGINGAESNGGWNGGGGGGCENGYGGGGASDVRTVSCGSSCATGGSATSLDSRLVVAAGGGGAGALFSGTCGEFQVGGSGGAAGSAGGAGPNDCAGDTGGGGGAQRPWPQADPAARGAPAPPTATSGKRARWGWAAWAATAVAAVVAAAAATTVVVVVVAAP